MDYNIFGRPTIYYTTIGTLAAKNIILGKKYTLLHQDENDIVSSPKAYWYTDYDTGQSDISRCARRRNQLRQERNNHIDRACPLLLAASNKHHTHDRQFSHKLPSSAIDRCSCSGGGGATGRMS